MTTLHTMQARPEVTAISSCRVCGSSDIVALYSLGNIFVSDFVRKPDDGIKAPLDMVMCGHCSLVQLRHTAPQEFMYTRFYWYRSGVTDTMKQALRNITEEIERRIQLRAGDVVLDIGSNDGTMLRTYAQKGLVKVGVEPASNLAEEGRKGLECFINDFWTYYNYWNVVGKKAKVITAIGMFYDMEDPNQFIRDAALALEDDGVFVAQLMCLKNMLDTNDVGNICHEHLEYYSLAALEFLFEKNGLRMIDIEHNTVNGGSYRVYAGLKDGKSPRIAGAGERMKRYRDTEKGLEEKRIHMDFFARMERNKKACVDFIRAEVKKGKSVWVYGASTKGNTILQYYGLDSSLIAAASERSPEKWGKYTVGTGIPIVSEEEARKRNPDYFLVLPYAFFDEFYRRESEWRKRGGKFIVPLPEFRIVS
ncbi:class I SAM-dependent methyltransferase [Candidatus Peregrinibacteria bacterium]|nr:class I SAM-dependent methyltransferase [Candidatus Peregrinibacteria bacterium]